MPFQNRLDVINAALNELGKLSVTKSSDNDTALLLDQKLDNIYSQLLEITGWRFALKVTTLTTPISSNPYAPEYPYVYQLPSDYVIMDNADSITNYKIIHRQLLTSQTTDLKFYYVSNTVAAWSDMPSTFVWAVVFALAASIALVNTSNGTLEQTLYQKSQMQLEDAVIQNEYQKGLINPLPHNSYNRISYL